VVVDRVSLALISPPWHQAPNEETGGLKPHCLTKNSKLRAKGNETRRVTWNKVQCYCYAVEAFFFVQVHHFPFNPPLRLLTQLKKRY
jgi:hypothetical protein